jgi:hypothetical protein
MLLSIAHYNRQLIGIALDRVLLSVHRAKPEYRSLNTVAAHVHGHGNLSRRRTAPLQRTVPERLVGGTRGAYPLN